MINTYSVATFKAKSRKIQSKIFTWSVAKLVGDRGNLVVFKNNLQMAMIHSTLK